MIYLSSEDFKPKPPGAFCLICKSNDVDAIGGKSKCNNCGGEWNVKVSYEIFKYPT